MTARKLRLVQVPVIELAHLTEAQKWACILAHNKLAEQAGWDNSLLALELGDLQDMAVDLASLGFDAAELEALHRSGEADEREDDIPPAQVVPVSQPGDLWLLGAHRLICGDATNAGTVDRVLNGVTIGDQAALAAYCQCYGRWVEAEEKLRSTQMLLKTATGYVQESPWLSIANKQLELMGRYMAELGLTPASRSPVASLAPTLPAEPLTIQRIIIAPGEFPGELSSTPRLEKDGSLVITGPDANL